MEKNVENELFLADSFIDSFSSPKNSKKDPFKIHSDPEISPNGEEMNILLLQNANPAPDSISSLPDSA